MEKSKRPRIVSVDRKLKRVTLNKNLPRGTTAGDLLVVDGTIQAGKTVRIIRDPNIPNGSPVFMLNSQFFPGGYPVK